MTLLSSWGMPLGWQPKVLALDIDGTLLRWVDGRGVTHEEVSDLVHQAVHRAADAGCHIVLASGRSPLSMAKVAGLLHLPPPGHDRLWLCASNGSVIGRTPPLEVVHEETFDAAEAVEKVLEVFPNALVAIEERGIGYRLNKHFPLGELDGEMILASVDELVRDPVSRVIIRDPEATAEEFAEVVGGLGLHGTNYVVGWTAWVDLSPVGVSKASGLGYICGELGIDPGDVLAIGDGRNDLEMFAFAGRSVAMGQAIDEVSEAADDVTLSVDEDGAAVEIMHWF
jgi:Cof subfamily protein (haloacid dehalogenase superfamily)